MVKQKSKQIEQFIDAARSFCDAIEKPREADPREFLSALQPRLVSLYAAGLALPDIDINDSNLLPDIIATAESASLCLSLGEYFGKLNHYWTALEAVAYTDTANTGIGMLSDDLADIYRDVKGRLIHWDHGDVDARLQAIWEWRFEFINHYGQHLLDAMRVIHRFVLTGYM